MFLWLHFRRFLFLYCKIVTALVYINGHLNLDHYQLYHEKIYLPENEQQTVHHENMPI